MAKGLFTNMEEIRFYHAFVNGNIETSKADTSFMDSRKMRQNNRRVAQNVKRLNQTKVKSHLRTR